MIFHSVNREKEDIKLKAKKKSRFWIIIHYDKNMPFNTFFQGITMTK